MKLWKFPSEILFTDHVMSREVESTYDQDVWRQIKHLEYLIDQPFSEHFRQDDHSMLAPRVVTVRVLVVLSGSYRSQSETGKALNVIADS